MKLSKRDILRLFEKLNQSLCTEGAEGELYLMGGAVMCLVFEARDARKVVDCLFKPTKLIREKAKAIADAEGLARDWLNDGVKGFLTDKGSFEPYLNLSHLKILTCSPAYLLAMKCLAMRIGLEFSDEEDIRFLIRYLNLESLEQTVIEITKYYPQEKFPQKTFFALQEIFQK